MQPQDQDQNQYQQPSSQIIQPTTPPDPSQSSTAQPQAVPAPSPAAAPVFTPAPQYGVPIGQPAQASKKKRLLKILTAALLATVLMGGVAAAYYWLVYVPNKPENKLAAAFLDLVEQRNVTLTGNLDYTAKGKTTAIKGFAVDFESKTNLESSTASLAGEIGVSGTTFPFEMRYVDKDVFVKVGGLNSLEALAPLLGGSDAAATYEQILTGVNDRWYVIDRSFMQEMGEEEKCVADISFVLTNEDIVKIRAAYERYPLFAIKSATEQAVEGTATTKFELEPASNETANSFAKELETLSVVEKVKACQKDEETTSVTETITSADNVSSGKLYAYITGDKQLKRLEYTSDDEDASLALVMDFSFQPVEVTKPEGAKPLQDLLGDFINAALLPPGVSGATILTD